MTAFVEIYRELYLVLIDLLQYVKESLTCFLDDQTAIYKQMQNVKDQLFYRMLWL